MSFSSSYSGGGGGAYIPPWKVALMKQQSANAGISVDMGGEEYQRDSWEALKKSINGLVNKLSVANIKQIIPEFFEENLIRGKGLFCKAILRAQQASPGFTHLYASLVAVINTKLPEHGELVLKRVIFNFKRAYKRRDKISSTALCKLVAHLVNQQVAHELLALELLIVLLDQPTNESVELAVNFTKEVGQILCELSPQGLNAIFQTFRNILHEGDTDKRVQYVIEDLFAIRKTGFKEFPPVIPDLDLVEKEDQITFELGFQEEIDIEENLDTFTLDPDFEGNENVWLEIKREILGDDDDDEEGDNDDGDECEAVKEDEEKAGGDGNINNAPDDALFQKSLEANKVVADLSQQEILNLKRNIYLTIKSAASFEECCHKLSKLNIPVGNESLLCNMIVDTCGNENSYQNYYGLI